MKTWASIVIATTVAGAPSLALAHHSFAAFDRSKKVVLVGVVKDFQWTNPHAWIQLVVQDSQGHPTEWGVECGSPNMMARTGWKKGLLAPGDQVAVTVNPLLDGRPNGSLVSITLNDGTVLGPGDAPPPRPLGSSAPR
ncbi:MAG TPA: DUF6152 family protein [Gammaproteobacteria bacterium]|nr:DUF6152 family protein [Gammaproteobacteria bacterium]